MLYIDFNNKNSYYDLGMAMKFPSLPSPEPRGDTINRPGGDGDLHSIEEGYKDLPISVDFEIVDKYDLMGKYRIIKSWIKNIKNPNLVFSYDEDMFYKVVKVEPVELNQRYLIHGELTLTFICKPHQYFKAGLKEIELSNNYILKNDTEETAQPLIHIEGSGLINLNVNSDSWQLSLTDSLYLDSELSLVYTTPYEIEGARKKGLGYPLLKPGDNTISWSLGLGGSVTRITLVPNWRCL